MVLQHEAFNRHAQTTIPQGGECGGGITNVGRDYRGCSAARKQTVCKNTASIRRGELDGLVLDALRTRFMPPELVDTFITEVTAEWRSPRAAKTPPSATWRRLSANWMD